MKSNRYWELDVLRFVAAFCVMVLHYFIRGYAADDHLSPYKFDEIGPVVRYLYMAVDFFFMISGFVILLSVERLPAGLGGGWQFLKSRVLRLYPAYLVACTLTFVMVRALCPNLVELSVQRYLLSPP